jgi:hypothetical protein
MSDQLGVLSRTDDAARWHGREREAFLELVPHGRRCPSQVCRGIVRAEREVKEAMWEVQDFKLEEVKLGCRGRWGLPAVSPTVFHHLHHHHFRPSSFIIISHLKQGHNIYHTSFCSLHLTLTSSEQNRNIMPDKLLIKLEKQRGEIDSQRDEVDFLHRIVTDIIQHGEDIGALKADNTLLKDENKKKDEQ